MARPLRLEFPGALYHVTARGDGREDIFLSDDDRRRFLDTLDEVWERFNWVVHAYCLMTNHYHLLVETPDANLAKGMRQLNGVYTQRFNRRHGRVGHVFQGRYKAILVQKDAYHLELSRYVVLNPVRAGVVEAPAEWPWSSFRATAGLESAPQWLSKEGILSALGGSEVEAAEHYARFVAAGIDRSSPWEGVRHQMFLGSEGFVDALRRKVPPGQDLREIPQARESAPPQPLAHYERSYSDRDEAIVAAYASGGYTMRAIGDHFGLHYSRVSKIVRAGGGRRRQK